MIFLNAHGFRHVLEFLATYDQQLSIKQANDHIYYIQDDQECSLP